MAYPAVKPEHEISLICARPAPAPGDDQRLRELLRSGIDGDYLVRFGRRHGLVPLLHRRLASLDGSGAERVPLGPLGDLARRVARRNLVLTAGMFGVLDLFGERGIRAVPFRGAAAAAELYGDVALRQFDDIDLLLRREDVPRARDILLSSGYRSEHPWSAAQTALCLRTDCELTFTEEGGSSIVELHWRLMPRCFPLRLGFGELWERRREIVVEGRTVPALSPEDLLLALCVHGGGKHRWERLLWISDLARLAASDRVDWELAAGRAAATGGGRMLSLGLLLATGLLGAGLPEKLERNARRDRAAARLAERCANGLFDDGPRARRPAGYCLFQIRVRERMRDRLLYCVRRAFTPTREDWETAALPRALGFLYYVLRPFRLLAKYGARLLRR